MTPASVMKRLKANGAGLMCRTWVSYSVTACILSGLATDGATATEFSIKYRQCTFKNKSKNDDVYPSFFINFSFY